MRAYYPKGPEEKSTDVDGAPRVDELELAVNSEDHLVRIAMLAGGRVLGYLLVKADDAVEIGESVYAAGIEVGGVRANRN